MAWIPTAAWIAAAVLAIVVLGFCAYEIVWKAKRLRRDVAELTAVATELEQLRSGIADVQRKLSTSGLG